MKQLFILLLILVGFRQTSQSQSLYSIPVKTIGGQVLDLTAYKGKKLAFIIVPLADTSSLLADLQSFQETYGNKVTLIGIPAIEEGFTKGNEQRLEKIYERQRIPILLTEGMHVRKAAKGSQSALLQWLTKKEKNQHFDMDVKGVGQLFFVDEGGKLYAVLSPTLSLKAPLIERIISKPFTH